MYRGLGGRGLLVLVATTTASFMTPFISTAISVAIPSISREMSVDYSTAGWAANSFLMILASTVYIVGRVADATGRERVFLVGVAIMTLSSYLTYLARDFATLVVFRALQGLGAAMVSGTAVAILSDVFSRSMRGSVIGINTTAVYIGTAAGPFLGGVLVGYYGWRSLFLLMTVVGIVSTIVALYSMRPWERGLSRERVAGLYKAPVLVLSILLTVHGSSIADSVYGVSELVAGLALLATVFMTEKSREGGLVPPQLLRHRLAVIYTATLLNYGATYAIGISLSTYLQDVLGLTPQATGYVLAVQTLTQALLTPLAGVLTDMYEPILLASIGMGAIASGIASMLVSGYRLSHMILSLVVIGAGFALFATPNTTAVMNMVEREVYGGASALLATMRFTGQALSTSIVSLIAATTTDITSLVSRSLLVYMILSIAATASLSSLLFEKPIQRLDTELK